MIRIDGKRTPEGVHRPCRARPPNHRAVLDLPKDRWWRLRGTRPPPGQTIRRAHGARGQAGTRSRAPPLSGMVAIPCGADLRSRGARPAPAPGPALSSCVPASACMGAGPAPSRTGWHRVDRAGRPRQAICRHLRLVCDFIFGMLRHSAARSCPPMRTPHSQPSRRSTSGKRWAKSSFVGQTSRAASRSAPCQLRSCSESSA